jgi:hypothetical protein
MKSLFFHTSIYIHIYYNYMLYSETVQSCWLNKSTLTETQHQTGLHDCLNGVISNGDDSSCYLNDSHIVWSASMCPHPSLLY